MITERAHAKLNLSLDILGTRNDGFHEVQMILQSIALADQLSFERSDAGINLTVEPSDIEGAELLPTDEHNLIVKSARIIFDRFNLDGGLAIRLKKNIPIGAGLAGGSADAATTLRALNKIFDLNLDNDRLKEIATEIGSDVPFCIEGGTALAEGRGERLTQLPSLPPIPIVLVKPHGAVSTAWAYKSYDADPSPEHPDNLQLVEAIKIGDVEAVGELMFNVLERVAVKFNPSIIDVKQRLLDAGAPVAMMSGSGPTVFALARSSEDANWIAQSIGNADAKIFVTNTI